MPSLRLLVLDAYAPEGRGALREAGGTEAGALYQRMLCAARDEAVAVDIRFPADPDPDLPDPRDYDGIAWTGSSLTIHDDDDVRVTRQIDYARRALAAEVPSFGSCWAAQLAAVAAGGECAPSPKGREFGISKSITLSAEGADHPLFRDKPQPFDGFTSHQDEVVQLPKSATLLASNGWSRVQAVSVGKAKARFWAVQYHPEYDLHEVASLCRLRAEELVGQGTFPDRHTANRFIENLEALHKCPGDAALAEELGVGDDLVDPSIRCVEARNWLSSLRGENP